MKIHQSFDQNNNMLQVVNLLKQIALRFQKKHYRKIQSNCMRIARWWRGKSSNLRVAVEEFHVTEDSQVMKRAYQGSPWPSSGGDFGSLSPLLSCVFTNRRKSLTGLESVFDWIYESTIYCFIKCMNERN